jgi:hypothetical protein
MCHVSFSPLKKSFPLHLCSSTAIVLILLGAAPSFCQQSDPAVQSAADKILPFSDDIQTLMNHMEYSGFAAWARPDVALRIDFERRKWTLTNIHRFDANGRFILDEGRYGLCGEMAASLHQDLKSRLGDRYDLTFVQAIEPDFFMGPQSSHMVLSLFDKASKTRYFIDPSFRKYGTPQTFDRYRFIDQKETLSFLKDHTADVSFDLGQAWPFFIRNDWIFAFALVSIDGKFDRDNFLLSITAHYHDDVKGDDIIAVGRYHGVFQWIEHEQSVKQWLKPEEVPAIHQKLEMFFKEIPR